MKELLDRAESLLREWQGEGERCACDWVDPEREDEKCIHCRTRELLADVDKAKDTAGFVDALEELADAECGGIHIDEQFDQRQMQRTFKAVNDKMAATRGTP